MNLILFSPLETGGCLPLQDHRARHIVSVLNIKAGQTFDVGLLNGPRGKAKLERVEKAGLVLSFVWEKKIPALLPIDLWVSFCRPQTCRRILQECTSLGAQSLTFFDTKKCEPTYKDSRLWSAGEAERLLLRGAEQAFCTRIPKLLFQEHLFGALEKLSGEPHKIALDNYEASADLGKRSPAKLPVILAVGGERGWDPEERDALRDAGFILVGLGPRVLRTDTACIAGLSILRAQIDDILPAKQR